MLFLDNAAPDSCCSERPLHIPTYLRLVSTAATVREKRADRPTDRPTDYSSQGYSIYGQTGAMALKIAPLIIFERQRPFYGRQVPAR